MPEDDIECEYFTVISTVSLLVYENKYYQQVNNCAYKMVNKQMTDYLDEIFLRVKYYKFCVTIELI